MGNLDNLLQRRMKQLGIKNQVDAAMVVEEAKINIKKVFGERGLENLNVISFKNGVLKINAANSAWAAECQGNASKIIKPPVKRLAFMTRAVRDDFI